MQYAPSGVPFKPKQMDKKVWKEDLVKIAGRWLLKNGEQIQPKDVDFPVKPG